VFVLFLFWRVCVCGSVLLTAVWFRGCVFGRCVWGGVCLSFGLFSFCVSVAWCWVRLPFLVWWVSVRSFLCFLALGGGGFVGCRFLAFWVSLWWLRPSVVGVGLGLLLFVVAFFFRLLVCLRSFLCSILSFWLCVCGLCVLRCRIVFFVVCRVFRFGLSCSLSCGRLVVFLLWVCVRFVLLFVVLCFFVLLRVVFALSFVFWCFFFWFLVFVFVVCFLWFL